MATIVIDLAKISLKDYLMNNEVNKGDNLKLFNYHNEECFTLDREFFNLNDPDDINYDDITEMDVFEFGHEPSDFHTLTVKGEKTFSQVEPYEDSNIRTIYGNLSFNNTELYEDLAFIVLW